MIHKTYHVMAKERKYSIEIATELLPKVGAYVRPLTSLSYVVVVTDTNVACHYLDSLRASLRLSGLEARPYFIDSGESHKNLQTYVKLSESILKDGIERQSLILALGGGVVGDLAGFVAATLLRGVNLVQIPTTLLAQVDSAVGGKTGVNVAVGKNLVGAFHQPSLVISDIDVLQTLPKRQMISGYAEIVKCALIADGKFFSWLEKDGLGVIEGKEESLAYAIKKSCAIKAAFVQRDERDESVRAFLNFGHTFGHAIEAAMHYDGSILHGEAVSVGMVLAYRMAESLGLVSMYQVGRVKRHFKDVGLPIRLKDVGKKLTKKIMLHHMLKDKKNTCGVIHFILPTDIGSCIIKQDVTLETLDFILQRFL